MDTILNLIANLNLMQVVGSLAYIGAGIAVFTGFATSIGQGLIGMKAVEGVARQPEASNKIMILTIIAQTVVETSAIYGMVVAFTLASK